MDRGIREYLNDRPRLAAVGSIGLIALALGVVVWQPWPRSYPKDLKRVYYSNDEGKTWFADDINKVPPFLKDGKVAYRAQVVQCPSGKPFVAFLMRYGEAEKKAMDEAVTRGKDPRLKDQTTGKRLEYRKPNGAASEWGGSSQALNSPTRVVCPDGSTDGKPLMP